MHFKVQAGPPPLRKCVQVRAHPWFLPAKTEHYNQKGQSKNPIIYISSPELCNCSALFNDVREPGFANFTLKRRKPWSRCPDCWPSRLTGDLISETGCWTKAPPVWSRRVLLIYTQVKLSSHIQIKSLMLPSLMQKCPFLFELPVPIFQIAAHCQPGYISSFFSTTENSSLCLNIW